MEPGITEMKKPFMKRMLKRAADCGGVGKMFDYTSLGDATSTAATPMVFNKYLAAVGFSVNKNEFENIFAHFSAGEGLVNIDAFLAALDVPMPGEEPIFYTKGPPSAHTAHLSLSGTSSMEFGVSSHARARLMRPSCVHHCHVPPPPSDAHTHRAPLASQVQSKPFPAHWGEPPNSQMKGHAGIMRALPGGYGKGNEPVAKYVAQNMEKDKFTQTDTYGNKPYPFGVYSLGSMEQGDPL